jgi:aryl-alcohol dehydrogenase-like predicted oxidoreductase
LAAAWDEGIRFFDTARSYGYGESETLMGEFLAGRREQAVIATKFGILAARQSGWRRMASTVARRILLAAPSAHSMFQKRAASQFSPNRFTIPVLQLSIEQSLRKLRTDCVDILFLHGAPASVLEQDDLLEAMGKLVEAGKVKIAGLSAEPDVVELAIRRRTKPLRAMQFPCNVFDMSAVGFVRQILSRLAGKQELEPVLREKLAALDDQTFADVVLNVILRDSGIHVVVPAMMRVEHIRANVQAVTNSRFDSQEIAHIRHALATATE